MTVLKKIITPAFVLVFIASLIFAENAKAQSKETEQKRKKYFEKYKLPQNNVKLKLVNSFPGEELLDKDIYIRKAVSISHDDSNIFTCDMDGHKIFVFDSNGSFLKKFGAEGQGPGDLIRPTTIIYWNDLLIVNDIGNLRIQFLDKNGQFKNSFRTFYVYYDLALDQNGQLYGAHFIKNNEPYIVDALALNGKKLSSFCEPIKSKDRKYSDHLNFVFLSANDKGEVYVAFSSYPLVRKFSRKGELIREINLNYPIMNDLKAYNDNAIDSNGEKRGLTRCINDIWVDGDRIFIALFTGRLEIIEFDLPGNVKNVYWSDENEEYFITDFYGRNDKGSYSFYVARLYPESGIDIYK